MTFEERHGVARDLLKRAVAVAEQQRQARQEAEHERDLHELGREFRAERAHDGRSNNR